MSVFNNIERLTFFRAMRLAVLFMFSWLLAPDTFGVKELDEPAQSFLKTHCVRCHDSEKQKGKFRLDNLGTDFDPASFLTDKTAAIGARYGCAHAVAYEVFMRS